MLKQSLYPKTKRIGKESGEVVLTEKLDGSNIGFFNLNNELLISTRNNVIPYSEIDFQGKHYFIKVCSSG